MRVLVVEDDPKIASFVVNGLKQSGFAVDHCADGESGLAMARSVPYDGVVVDIMLPKLDGLTLVQTLRAEGKNIPVLILSAKTTVDDRVRGLQAGGDDYLVSRSRFASGQGGFSEYEQPAKVSIVHTNEKQGSADPVLRLVESTLHEIINADRAPYWLEKEWTTCVT
jgi:CheY-like chemotaxis protein